MSSIKVLEAKLDAHLEDAKEKWQEVALLKKAMENKVSYKQFTWVLGILITILISMFTYIANQMGDIRSSAISINQDVSMIKGKLDPYNIEFKN